MCFITIATHANHVGYSIYFLAVPILWGPPELKKTLTLNSIEMRQFYELRNPVIAGAEAGVAVYILPSCAVCAVAAFTRNTAIASDSRNEVSLRAIIVQNVPQDVWPARNAIIITYVD